MQSQGEIPKKLYVLQLKLKCGGPWAGRRGCSWRQGAWQTQLTEDASALGWPTSAGRLPPTTGPPSGRASDYWDDPKAHHQILNP